ncbi:MAG: methyl-accepting chemotaxis protein [Methylovulum sp.]|nr:methyl-accepting chemotaxis protein [Methylovulum sp.]
MKTNMPVTDKEVLMPKGAFLVTRTNLDGIITYANDAFVETSGFTREELIGANHNLTRHPDVSEAFYKELWAILKQGRPWHDIIKNRTKSGDFYWTETNITPIYTNGKVYEYLAVRYAVNRDKIDNTGQKNQKRNPKTSKLRPSKSTAKFKQIREMAIWKKGGLALTALLLPNFFLMYQLVLAQNYTALALVALLAAIATVTAIELFGTIGSSLETFIGITYRFLNDSFKISVDLTRNDQIGDCLRALFSLGVKFNADLANSKERECHLQEKDRINRDFISQVEAIGRSQAVIQFNLDGTIITANDLFLNATGYSLEEIKGKHHSMFVESVFAQSAEYRQFWEKLKRGEHDAGEYKRISKSGNVVYLRASYNPILDSNGKPYKVVKYASDVTKETIANQTLERIFADIGSIMKNLANGDLTKTITHHYEGIYGECKDNINEAVAKFSEVFVQIRDAADFIDSSSQEISAGNNNLSHRAEQQAANLEETAASMEELTSIVKNTAANANEASQAVNSAKDLAVKGGNVVKSAITAMQEINESSNQIAEIISVIDEIAFQTNLLALNASVEAARAGEQGRGFSVVASEVRNLAQRSAAAAKQSNELIQNSVQKVRTGTAFVNETGVALNEIVGSVAKASEIVAQIAAASSEQTAGIEQVNMAVGQLDEITQQNAALAEQASAASISMSEQSTNMIHLLNFFKINSQSHAAAPRSTVDRLSIPTAKIQTAPIKKSAAIKSVPTVKSSADDVEWEEF